MPGYSQEESSKELQEILSSLREKAEPLSVQRLEEERQKLMKTLTDLKIVKEGNNEAF